MSIQATCEGCGEPFKAVRTSAKWCSDRCRKAKARTAVEEHEDVDEPDLTPSGLVDSVFRDLESAGRLETFSGQLALQLAKRLSSPDESGISSLSKELRTVMAAAMEGVAPPAGDDESDGEVEDEVTRARRQREEAREAAGLA